MREMEPEWKTWHAGQPEGWLFAGVPGWGTCVPLFFYQNLQVLKLAKPLFIFSADENSCRWKGAKKREGKQFGVFYSIKRI